MTVLILLAYHIDKSIFKKKFQLIMYSSCVKSVLTAYEVIQVFNNHLFLFFKCPTSLAIPYTYRVIHGLFHIALVISTRP